MKLLLSHFTIAVGMLQAGHALPQANKDGDAVGHIVVLKEGLTANHLYEHIAAVKGIQRQSKRDDTGETGVKHVIDGASYGFQGYTGLFTPEALKFIESHEHVDYIEEGKIISEPRVESRDVSAADLVPVDESVDTANPAKASAGALNGQKSTISGTLSWGQGYSTLLGEGLRLDVVVPWSDNARRSSPVVLNETNPATAFNFTAPSANLTGVNLDEYFAEPDPDTIFDNIPDSPEMPKQSVAANGKREVVQIPGCSAKISTHYKFAEDYSSYLHSLDVSASLAITGWGQSAAVSGTYLDQAKMSNDALTFVATIEVEKEQNFPNGLFDAESYTPAQFHRTHGDRWIRGYRRGGKLMARLIFKAKDSSKTNEVKAHAEAALKFWGVTGDISASVKNSMEQVNKHASVDIAMFQQGNLGTLMTGTKSGDSTDESAIGSSSGSFKQVKEWADKFMQQACSHDFAYQPVPEKYSILSGFPADQRVHDYSVARIMSSRVLGQLVKLSELVAAIRRSKFVYSDESMNEQYSIQREKMIDGMDFAFWGIVAASKQWVEQTADDPTTAMPSAKALIAKFREFSRTYKKLLVFGTPIG